MPWSKKKKAYTEDDLLGDYYADLLRDDSFDDWYRKLLEESGRSIDAALKQIEKDDALLFGTQTTPKPEPPLLPPLSPAPAPAPAPVAPKRAPIDKAARQKKKQVKQAIQLLIDRKSIFETAMTTGVSPSELTDLRVFDRPFRRDLDVAIEDRQALAAQGDDTVALRRYEQTIQPDIQPPETPSPELQPLEIPLEILPQEMQPPVPLEIKPPVTPESQPPVQPEMQIPPEQPISAHKRFLQALRDEIQWVAAGMVRLIDFTIPHYTRKD
ncbi:MAG: hypothetical protein HUU31_24160 [Anaerolineae bacterium]|nr:hypothetical protein [Anaerolineae bacterium]